MSTKDNDVVFSRSVFYEFMLESEDFIKCLPKSEKNWTEQRSTKKINRSSPTTRSTKNPYLEVESEVELAD